MGLTPWSAPRLRALSVLCLALVYTASAQIISTKPMYTGPPEGEYTIYISSPIPGPDGVSPSILDLTVEGTTTLAEVKTDISDLTGLAVEQLYLFLFTTALVDDALTLNDYYVSPESTFRLGVDPNDELKHKFILLPDGAGIYTATIEDEQTIGDLKQELEIFVDIPAKEQHLFRVVENADELKDDMPLGELTDEPALSLWRWKPYEITKLKVDAPEGTIYYENGDIDRDTTILEIKEKLAENPGYELENQRLFYYSNLLDDKLSLYDYYVAEGDTLNLIMVPSSEADYIYIAVNGIMVKMMELTATTTVADIKNLVLLETDTPLDYQHVYWNGEDLANDVILQDKGVVDESVLSLWAWEPYKISQIFIKTVDDSQIAVEVNAATTIGDVEAAVAEVLPDTVASNLRLFYYGQLLESDKTLEYYYLANDSVLDLFVMTPVANDNQVFITTYDGRILLLGVRLDDYVYKVKEKIKKRTGQPRKEQVLYFNDVELDDGQILGSYGVTDGSVLRMWSGDLIAAKGGPLVSPMTSASVDGATYPPVLCKEDVTCYYAMVDVGYTASSALDCANYCHQSIADAVYLYADYMPNGDGTGTCYCGESPESCGPLESSPGSAVYSLNGALCSSPIVPGSLNPKHTSYKIKKGTTLTVTFYLTQATDIGLPEPAVYSVYLETPPQLPIAGTYVYRKFDPTKGYDAEIGDTTVYWATVPLLASSKYYKKRTLQVTLNIPEEVVTGSRHRLKAALYYEGLVVEEHVVKIRIL